MCYFFQFLFSSGKKVRDILSPTTTTTTELVLTPDGTVVPAVIHHVHHHSAHHHIHMHHPLALGHHHHPQQHNHVVTDGSVAGSDDGRGTPNGYCSTPSSAATVIDSNGVPYVSSPVDMAYFIPVTPAADFATVTASNSSSNSSNSVTKSNPATMDNNQVNCCNDGGDEIDSNSVPQNSLSLSSSKTVTTGLINSPTTTMTTVVAVVPTIEGGYTLATTNAPPGTVPVTTSKYCHKILS